MANSRDYDELVYTWKAWHDASGKHMREDYKKYVELQNKAAAANGTYYQFLEPWGHK